jgi:predicted aspartyl protease
MKVVLKNWLSAYDAKRLVSSIAFIPVALFILASPVGAEVVNSCFMVTSSGKTINLGGICGEVTANTRNFRVPIKRRSGKTPVIDVTFNGNQVFEMIVDTGASGTLVTEKMAKALQIKTSGTVNASIADGSQVQFRTGVVQSIGVNGAIVNNVEVAIAPRGEVGLLGHDFFGNYDIKILEKEIEFSRR